MFLFADRSPARACCVGVGSGVRREALGAHPLLGPGTPLQAPATPQPLPHGALRAPLPSHATPPQLPHPAT
jgi:hypothetical protein